MRAQVDCWAAVRAITTAAADTKPMIFARPDAGRFSPLELVTVAVAAWLERTGTTGAEPEGAPAIGAEPAAGAADDELSCAAATVPELVRDPVLDSVSRFRRLRSARMSEACW